MADTPDQLWKWLREDLSTDDFTAWLYTAPTAEAELGQDLFVELISLDYRDHDAVHALRVRLIRELPRACLCPLFRDRQLLGLTNEMASVDALFDALRDHTLWLHHWRCKTCGQDWYVALDDRDDAWYFQRLTSTEASAIEHGDVWPTTFDDFDAVWRDGKARFGHPRGFSLGLWGRFIEGLPVRADSPAS